MTFKIDLNKEKLYTLCLVLCLQYAKKQNKHDLFDNFVEACFLLDQ